MLTIGKYMFAKEVMNSKSIAKVVIIVCAIFFASTNIYAQDYQNYQISELELELCDHCSLAGLGLKQINRRRLPPSLRSI